MLRHQQYAAELLSKHGLKDALRIANRSLLVSQRENGHLTLFDEADFFINDYGKYEYSKIQTKKPLGRKQKRAKSAINFWALIVQILNKSEKKNVVKN